MFSKYSSANGLCWWICRYIISCQPVLTCMYTAAAELLAPHLTEWLSRWSRRQSRVDGMRCRPPSIDLPSPSSPWSVLITLLFAQAAAPCCTSACVQTPNNALPLSMLTLGPITSSGSHRNCKMLFVVNATQVPYRCTMGALTATLYSVQPQLSHRPVFSQATPPYLSRSALFGVWRPQCSCCGWLFCYLWPSTGNS